MKYRVLPLTCAGLPYENAAQVNRRMISGLATDRIQIGIKNAKCHVLHLCAAFQQGLLYTTCPKLVRCTADK